MAQTDINVSLKFCADAFLKFGRQLHETAFLICDPDFSDLETVKNLNNIPDTENGED